MAARLLKKDKATKWLSRVFREVEVVVSLGVDIYILRWVGLLKLLVHPLIGRMGVEV